MELFGNQQFTDQDYNPFGLSLKDERYPNRSVPKNITFVTPQLPREDDMSRRDFLQKVGAVFGYLTLNNLTKPFQLAGWETPPDERGWDKESILSSEIAHIPGVGICETFKNKLQDIAQKRQGVANQTPIPDRFAFSIPFGELMSQISPESDDETNDLETIDAFVSNVASVIKQGKESQQRQVFPRRTFLGGRSPVEAQLTEEDRLQLLQDKQEIKITVINDSNGDSSLHLGLNHESTQTLFVLANSGTSNVTPISLSKVTSPDLVSENTANRESVVGNFYDREGKQLQFPPKCVPMVVIDERGNLEEILLRNGEVINVAHVPTTELDRTYALRSTPLKEPVNQTDQMLNYNQAVMSFELSEDMRDDLEQEMNKRIHPPQGTNGQVTIDIDDLGRVRATTTINEGRKTRQEKWIGVWMNGSDIKKRDMSKIAWVEPSTFQDLRGEISMQRSKALYPVERIREYEQRQAYEIPAIPLNKEEWDYITSIDSQSASETDFTLSTGWIGEDGFPYASNSIEKEMQRQIAELQKSNLLKNYSRESVVLEGLLAVHQDTTNPDSPLRTAAVGIRIGPRNRAGSYSPTQLVVFDEDNRPHIVEINGDKNETGKIIHLDQSVAQELRENSIRVNGGSFVLAAVREGEETSGDEIRGLAGKDRDYWIMRPEEELGLSIEQLTYDHPVEIVVTKEPVVMNSEGSQGEQRSFENFDLNDPNIVPWPYEGAFRPGDTAELQGQKVVITRTDGSVDEYPFYNPDNYPEITHINEAGRLDSSINGTYLGVVGTQTVRNNGLIDPRTNQFVPETSFPEITLTYFAVLYKGQVLIAAFTDGGVYTNSKIPNDTKDFFENKIPGSRMILSYILPTDGTKETKDNLILRVITTLPNDTSESRMKSLAFFDDTIELYSRFTQDIGDRNKQYLFLGVPSFISTW